MSIFLISPPTVSEVRDLGMDPAAARALAAQSAPLGILTLAAVLETHGLEPSVVDLNRELSSFLRVRGSPSTGGFAAAIAERLAAEGADVYGFTTIWSSYPFTIRVAQRIKELAPETTIVLGGPQASVVDVGTLETFPFIDAVLRGEADDSFPLYLAALRGEIALSDVPGLTARLNGELVVTGDPLTVLDLDRLPFPAFHLYGDLSTFRHLPLELGRGCPFGCKFCSTNEFFSRRFRVKSPARLIADMRALNERYGATRFDLIHDMFTARRKTVIEFCQAMIEAETGFEWFCSARTDRVDDELLALMAEAGCRSVFFGIETGSPRLQVSIDKHLDLSGAEDRIRAASDDGMLTTVSLILGHADETRDDLRATVAFLADALRHDYVDPQIHLLTPLSGTPLERAFRGQLIFDDPYGDLSHSGWPQEDADRELVMTFPEIFSSFYSLPLAHLDRAYVQELRLFLYHAIPRHRWLLVALHQEGNDLLDLFDTWREWASSAASETLADDRLRTLAYGSDQSSASFLEFVESTFAQPPAQRGLRLLIDYSRALDHTLRATNDVEEFATNVVCRCAGVHVIRVGGDVPGLIRSLRAKKLLDPMPAEKTLVTRPRGQRLEIVELSPLLTTAIELCDGESSAEAVAEELVEHCDAIAGLPPEEVARVALDHLSEQRFIRFNAAERGPTKTREPVIS
jgi:radical SAM superfamily enzyme YgiQ (UPF0313 family)